VTFEVKEAISGGIDVSVQKRSLSLCVREGGPTAGGWIFRERGDGGVLWWKRYTGMDGKKKIFTPFFHRGVEGE